MGYFFTKRRRRRKKSLLPRLPKISKIWVIIILAIAVYCWGVKEGWWQKVEIGWDSGHQTISSKAPGKIKGEQQKQASADFGLVILNQEGRLCLEKFDGQIQRIPQDNQTYKDFSSPDQNGFLLAILNAPAESQNHLIRFNLATGKYQILQRNFPRPFAPVLSWDGSQMAWVEKEGQAFSLYLAQIDGSQKRKIAHYHRPIFSPRFSLDGCCLAYVVTEAGKSKIVLVDLVTSKQSKEYLVGGQVLSLAVKNPTEILVALTTRTSNQTATEIYLLTPHQQQPLTTSSFQKQDLVLSPNGKTLFYLQKPGLIFRLNLSNPIAEKVGPGNRLLGVKRLP